MDFERLMREAGYVTGTPESIQFYLKGLPTSVAKDILRPPFTTTYQTTVNQAQDSVKSQELIAGLMKLRGPPPNQQQRAWQNFGGEWMRNQPPPQQGYPQYNSTNAPRSHNNVPVPMDLSQTRSN